VLIGIDFDNTLACYDQAFTAAARARGFISDENTLSKFEIRNRVQTLKNGEAEWRALQGEVYGKRIEEAKLMPGAADFFLACKERRVRVVIVSHKTKFGHFDPDRVNLRDAAVAWMRAQNFFDKKLLGVSVRNVFFEGTRAGKLGRIKALGCSHFIDDLEEVLLEPGFPNNVVRILFDPDGRAANDRGFERHSDWKSIEHAIFAT